MNEWEKQIYDKLWEEIKGVVLPGGAARIELNHIEMYVIIKALEASGQGNLN